MEQKPEEFVANETVGSADFRSRDCNIPMNTIESEGCRLSESPSPGLCASISSSSGWPGSSTLTHFDSVKHYSLNGGELSLASSAPILRSPYLTNDAGFTVEEIIPTNYGYANARVDGCSSSKEEINNEGTCSHSIGWTGQSSRIAGEEFMSNNKDSLELYSRKVFSRVITSFQDVNVLSNNQKIMDSTGISTMSTNAIENPNTILLGNGPIGEILAHVTEGPSNITSSNRLGGGRCSSSFSNFFFGRSQGDPCGNPRASNESHMNKTYNTTMHNENMHEYLSGEVSDASMNRNFLNCSHDIAREELELPHCDINLREWLESKGVNASKNEKMILFRQIVKIVDVVHSQGIVLLELRPSSFILSETRDVKYIGSLMETKLVSENHDNTKKRGLEREISFNENFPAKRQNLGIDKSIRPESHFISRIVKDNVTDHFSHGIIDINNCSNSLPEVQDFSSYESTSIGKTWLTSQNAQLEQKWYAFPEVFKIGDVLSLNIYSLGLLLFEFLCHFESIEAHSAAMLDLHNRILPPFLLSNSPKEAGFCFWLLHPEPCSRPTTREILQSDLIAALDIASPSNNEVSCVDMVDDDDSDLLLHFLHTLKQDKQNKACNLLESIKLLDLDMKVVESGQASRRFSDMMDGGYDSNLKDETESPYSSISRINVLKEKLLGNMSELENAYLSVRCNQLAEMPDMTRLDKDVLRKRDHLSWVGTRHNSVTTEEKHADRVGTLFDGICKFARYNKFEVCGTLRNGDILNSSNVICSLSFDPEEEYIAAAGVSKKIKIFELHSLLNDYVDVQYPVVEMSNKSKFSCICWNHYIKSYLASTDYDGVVQIWDAGTGQGFGQYNEHQKRAWSVDFCRVDPRKFASGGDDCSLNYGASTRNSTGTIWNPANICCVEFSSYSSHLLAFGSADYKIYCYDLRHTRIPWCTLAGHDNAVSYVRFLDAETLVSASIDNTLKLWDLKKTRLDGLSPDACSLTFRGHTNDKNFVGLAVLDGYIACGSETNEVYAYYKSLPMPISRHRFECSDNKCAGDETNDGNAHFVSSVCWRRKSQLIAAANSSGTINILRLAC